MTDTFANSVVLCSLPPSDMDGINDFAMEGETVTFRKFMSKLRNVKVESIKGEIINSSCICDIQVINVSC